MNFLQQIADIVINAIAEKVIELEKVTQISGTLVNADRKGRKIDKPVKRGRAHKSENAVCIAENCNNAAKSKRFCVNHYQQFRRGSIDEHGLKIFRKRETVVEKKPCKINSCRKLQVYSIGFCTNHYQQFKRGTLDEDGRKIQKARTPKSNETVEKSSEKTDSPL